MISAARTDLLLPPPAPIVSRVHNTTVKILVAITGASGALYAQRLLDNLDPKAHEIHVVLSRYAQLVMAEELPGGLRRRPE